MRSSALRTSPHTPHTPPNFQTHTPPRTGAHLTGGTDLVPYNGPTPPVGTHHYHVALFQQTGPGPSPDPPKSRCKFDVEAFADTNGLTRKADVVYTVAVRRPRPHRRPPPPARAPPSAHPPIRPASRASDATRRREGGGG